MQRLPFTLLVVIGLVAGCEDGRDADVPGLNGGPRVRVRLASERTLYLWLDGEVEVVPLTPDGNEWDRLGVETEVKVADARAASVQPAPDARRELEWVAAQVKRLLLEEKVRPHDIAVVARTGRDDARQTHEIFNRAGIPNTARIRTPFAQIPAQKRRDRPVSCRQGRYRDDNEESDG